MANKNKTNFNYDLIFYISLVLIVLSLTCIGARLTGNIILTEKERVNVNAYDSKEINSTTNFLKIESKGYASQAQIKVEIIAPEVEDKGNGK